VNPLTLNAIRKPGVSLTLAAVFSLLMMGLVAAPTLAPDAFPFLQSLKVDTDPENMLAADEPVRIFHNDMKAEFTLHDLIVVGVVNERNEQGVFNVETLSDVYDLAEFANSIRRAFRRRICAANTGSAMPLSINGARSMAAWKHLMRRS